MGGVASHLDRDECNLTPELLEQHNDPDQQQQQPPHHGTDDSAAATRGSSTASSMSAPSLMPLETPREPASTAPTTAVSFEGVFPVHGNELHRLLCTTRVETLVRYQGPISVASTTDTVAAVLQRMKEANVHSLPVLESLNGATYGLLSSSDFIGLMKRLRDLPPATKCESFLSAMVGDVLYVSRREEDDDAAKPLQYADYACAVRLTDPLKLVVELMNEPEKPRRLIVYSDSAGPSASRVITHVIGQRRVLEFVHEHMDQLDMYAKTKVTRRAAGSTRLHTSLEVAPLCARDLMQPLENVVSITPDTTAEQALYHLYDCKLRVFPVVNEQGSLLGSISSSDIRGLDREHFDCLSLGVLDFLKKLGQYREPLTVPPAATFAQVVETMVHAGVHHLYVTDDERHPRKLLGLIAISELLALLVV